MTRPFRFAVLVLAVFLGASVRAQTLDSWVGRWPSEMLQDGGIQPDLATLLGQAGMERLVADMGVEEPITREGDWVVARGCAPHMCGDSRGGFAVHVMTGQVVAVVHDDAGIVIWGGQLPPSLAEIALP